MGRVITLGGERVGSGNKMTEYLHGYSRSSHDIGGIVATDQATGTLVPYFCDIATNGTTYYIEMATKVRTLPTNGPLFGTFKHQLDWYSIPIRLYIGALHNNALGIGLDMKSIKLPKMAITIFGNSNDTGNKISRDCLLAYIGIRETGYNISANEATKRKFPAIFMLAYWDIYKNYYANKQEEIGYYIQGYGASLADISILTGNPLDEITSTTLPEFKWTNAVPWSTLVDQSAVVALKFNNVVDEAVARNQKIYVRSVNGEETVEITFTNPEKWSAIQSKVDPKQWQMTPLRQDSWTSERFYRVNGPVAIQAGDLAGNPITERGIKLTKFPLSNIDKMRETILSTAQSNELIIDHYSNSPYNACLTWQNSVGNKSFSQCGLGIKTYLSDRFNNWLSTEWIDGAGTGINEITSVDVSDGKLSMDELILSKKLYNLLNRVAISGGSYNDWQEAVYDVKTIRLAESPMYCGGMSSEIVFDEVVANSGYQDENGTQALGTLAGRGADKVHKGGRNLKIRIEEPSMIMCIGSITPRIFYSQGNKWWNQLETMDDLHKPGLDQIGFQELLTEEFAGFDTRLSNDLGGYAKKEFHSVGKQPSWIEYMTNVNESYGSFAAGEELSWMVLNRSYKKDAEGRLQDATTYIDPTIYNNAFADTKLTAKNFWVQIAFDITARRKMSANQIPEL